MVTVSDPLFLVLLTTILPLWWLGSRSKAVLGERQATVAFFLRSTIVTLLVLALAGLRWQTTRDDVAVLALVDVSLSMPANGIDQAAKKLDELSSAGGNARLAVASFDTETRLLANFANGAPLPKLESGVAPGSDLTAALTSTAALLPGDRPGRIVVLTDGHADDPESALAAAVLARRAGVPVDIIAIHPDRGSEVEIATVSVPGRLQPGEAFDAMVTVRATETGPANLRAYQDEVLVGETVVELTGGESRHRLSNLTAPAGVSSLRMEISASADTLAANNSFTTQTIVSGGSRVLLLDPASDALQPLADLLRGEGFTVEIRRPEDAPESLDAWQRFDFVLLSDTPALALGDARMDALQKWVSEFGGGLLIAGGERSFASGGYFETPLASLSPVRIDYADSAELPVVALLVVLDRSGSMSAPVGGTTKMALANQGAVRAMEVLQPKDLFGVFAVDTQVRPVLPLARIADQAAATRRILGIDAGGGGIYIFTALGAAYRALSDADARIRHVILFSDAADAEEKVSGTGASGQQSGPSSLDLAAAMLSKRISVSVVALGAESDRDTGFLRNLASRGGGRFYLTTDALSLPRIFTEETLRATRANLIEEAFQAVAARSADETQGIDWADAPFLLGYNATQAKPSADVLLTTESGEPLLARWRFGLGQVAAFTSDVKGRWSADWLEWPGFGKLVTQTMRSLVRRDDNRGLAVQTSEENGRLMVEVDANDADGAFRNRLPVAVSVSNDQTGSMDAIARQTAPGRYRAEFPLAGATEAVIAVSDGTEAAPVNISWQRATLGEFSVLGDTGPFLQRLAAAGGGLLDPAAADVFRPTGQSVPAPVDLTIPLLVLALLLIPVDIWVRRRDSTPRALRTDLARE